MGGLMACEIIIEVKIAFNFNALSMKSTESYPTYMGTMSHERIEPLITRQVLTAWKTNDLTVS